ncbi:MAG: PEGA domain-containing protein, partial [bacterium]
MKQFAAAAKKAVRRARSLGWLPTPKAKAPTRRSSSPAATARKSGPQAAATLLLKVESNPAGATVQLGSRIVGKTPVTLKVAPGTHKVTFTRKGYVTITRTVTMGPGKTGQLQVAMTEAGAAVRTPVAASKPAATTKPAASTRKPAPAAKKPSPAAKKPVPAPVSGRLLETGTRAPAIALKDPTGAFHRLSDYRNRQVVVLFLWTLDSAAMRLVQDLDGRVRGSGQSLAGLVVVVNGDRAAVQRFSASARVQVPLVLGDDQTARAYGVPKATSVAYVVSEGGLIAQRQVKTIQLSSLFTQE